MPEKEYHLLKNPNTKKTNFRNPDMAKILQFPVNHFSPSTAYRIEVSEIITFRILIVSGILKIPIVGGILKNGPVELKARVCMCLGSPIYTFLSYKMI